MYAAQANEYFEEQQAAAETTNEYAAALMEFRLATEEGRVPVDHEVLAELHRDKNEVLAEPLSLSRGELS